MQLVIVVSGNAVKSACVIRFVFVVQPEVVTNADVFNYLLRSYAVNIGALSAA